MLVFNLKVLHFFPKIEVKSIKIYNSIKKHIDTDSSDNDSSDNDFTDED